ncbi:hypothetical protein Cantr_07427 [Candida viswanathii]|uniref:Uncharacterized protein n=1 Tax=Candida viswanathii TaxID=5486 RepID=A0A367Y027_9ASCO|nr:hypothetical protein Cantr_07427 [Candida viswanathii]
MALQIYGLVRGVDGSKFSVYPANITADYIYCFEMTGIFVTRDGGLWLEDGSGLLIKLREDPDEETVITDAVPYQKKGLEAAIKHGVNVNITLTPEEESRAPGEFAKLYQLAESRRGLTKRASPSCEACNGDLDCYLGSGDYGCGYCLNSYCVLTYIRDGYVHPCILKGCNL